MSVRRKMRFYYLQNGGHDAQMLNKFAELEQQARVNKANPHKANRSISVQQGTFSKQLFVS